MRPDFQLIVAPNPGAMTLEGTNSYLVGREPCWIVDPGPAIDSHVEALTAAAGDRGGAEAVVLTHDHPDHAEGAHLLGVPVIRPREGDEAGPFEVIDTPGHSADHVCLLIERTCWCGDVILGHGSSWVPPDGGSLASYMRSLERLRSLDLELLLPGHGPEIDDPESKIAEYVEHRMMRERKLLAALDAGTRSREELLRAAWDDVPAPLLPAAALVMEAHLQKLADEDRLPSGVGP